MEDTFANLYNVLLHSEQLVNDEFKQINAVKSKTAALKASLDDQRKETMKCALRISKHERDLAGCTIKVQETMSKEEFYRETKESLETNVSALKSHLAELDSRIMMESAEFVEKVHRFNETFGLGKMDASAIANNAKKDCLKLETKREQLISGLETLTQKTAQVQSLVEKKKEISLATTQIQEKIEDLDIKKDQEMAKVAELKGITVELLDGSETREEFNSLQNDLARFSTEELEKEGQQLRQELNRLQALVRRKHVQQQKQQFVLWQRRRAQMNQRESCESKTKSGDRVKNE